MGKEAKPLVPEVKEYKCKCHYPTCTLHDGRRGYGVTVGRKWHGYLFTSQDGAQKLVDAIKDDQRKIQVNVAYNAPFAWARSS